MDRASRSLRKVALGVVLSVSSSPLCIYTYIDYLSADAQDIDFDRVSIPNNLEM